MVKRALVWAAGNSRLQQQVTENPIARRVAHRFVAGERLDEALTRRPSSTPGHRRHPRPAR